MSASDFLAICFLIIVVGGFTVMFLLESFYWIKEDIYFPMWRYFNVTKPAEKQLNEEERKRFQEEFFRKWDKWMQEVNNE